MKKIKFLFIMLIGILLIPSVAYAADDTSSSTEENQAVNVYFFYGDGCSYCAAAEKFFDSIEDELGDKFDIVSYETWYDTDNVDLMNEVADIRKEEPQGVPYIIIGNQSWDGYTSSYDDEIIDKIQSEYEKDTDSRYDVMTYVESVNGKKEDNYASDIAVVLAIILVVAGIGFGIWYARGKANEKYVILLSIFLFYVLYFFRRRRIYGYQSIGRCYVNE